MNKVLVVCGPTAVGKTSVAVSLAGKLNGEIVSADSRQAYKGLDVGTGKDIPKNSKFHILNSKFSNFNIGYCEISKVPVWLLDVVLPKYQFNVADWLKCANVVIKDIWKRGKLPIVVGGTGFYIKALVDGIGSLGIRPDKKLRRKLEELSIEQLQNKLKKLALGVWKKMNSSDRANMRRLIRKIEISLSGNIEKAKPMKADYLMIGLSAPRRIIYQRIDQRVKQRLAKGLIEEIKDLLKQGVSWEDPGMDTLAYKEFRDYFATKKGLSQAIERWRFDEHRYARRQLTWFKKDQRIEWFDITIDNWQNRMERLIIKWYSRKR